MCVWKLLNCATSRTGANRMKLVHFWKDRQTLKTVLVPRYLTTFHIYFSFRSREISRIFLFVISFLDCVCLSYIVIIWDFHWSKLTKYMSCYVVIPCVGIIVWMWCDERTRMILVHVQTRTPKVNANRKKRKRKKKQSRMLLWYQRDQSQKVFHRKLTGSHIFVRVLIQFCGRFICIWFHLQM